MSFIRLSKIEAFESLRLLIAKYKVQRRVIESPSSRYTETEARGEFIDPFLILFGWDVHNDAGSVQSQRSVVLEHAANPDAYVIGRPDYRLRINGRDRLPVEAKKPSVRLNTSAKSSLQARSYGWSLSLPAAVLTNFSETIIFDARHTPVENQDPDEAVIPGCRISFEDYEAKFDLLWDYLAFENVSDDEKFSSVHNYVAPPRGTSPFDKTFLAHFRNWRLALSTDIAAGNILLGAAEVGRRTQQVLNALLFLRVCEDRDIWTYQRLLKSARSEAVIAAFEEADRVFNAGLFTVLKETAVTAEILRSVISELYWPKTKFAFGVMRPDVLAELYEQYLSERVQIGSDRGVTLVQKPELTHTNGVVPTPQYIVDSLVDAPLTRHLSADNSISEDLRIVDLACGSGVFLLAVFERLLSHLEKAGATTLATRSHIATQHLFGVDIDAEAVEVTRLSLLLAILGEARVDPKTDFRILPDLTNNVRAGNAVVSTDFDQRFPSIASDPGRRAAVAQFSWNDAFPQVMAEGGFSIVFANPPYVRVQTLQAHMPDQLAYFQDSRSEYRSGSGLLDLYMIFVERAISLLRLTGELAMIVPHTLTNAGAASAIREELGRRLTKLVHFGVNQVFPGRLTYTALIFAGRKTEDDAALEIVEDLHSWRAGASGVVSPLTRADLGGAPWPMASALHQVIFGKMQDSAIAILGDKHVAEVYVGVQTSKNDYYFFRPNDAQSDTDLVAFTDPLGANWTIERGIVRPSLLDRSLTPYDISPEPDGFVIFPYRILPAEGKKKARALPLSRAELELSFPRALAYFDAHRDELLNRSISPDPGEAFWAYGRSQNLVRMDLDKVIIRTMSLSPQYVKDPGGIVVSGGGHGGPYTLMTVPEDGLYPQNVIIAIASHPAADSFVASRGKAYQGAYLVHTKGTLHDIPIPSLGKSDVERIDSHVRELQMITKGLRAETDSVLRSSLEQRSTNLRANIEAIISDAFGLDSEDMAVLRD
ncbi:Eco57I restriction-modification methylase domain-containing protein [Glaciihabitans sp. dw_435]|uniref:Eco57I restriction-modification methylase domain-containing protein n=1 Tax=Glaciihabitans sp. dw_435 TaxID=2720081 RepID=UPI001BD2BF4B|nr:DNA methyltransferase [Glaciihabitans sp. dw_435]